MAALLTPAERWILEAACASSASGGGDPAALTDVIRRRTLAHVPGPEFRRGVSSLTERGLLRAQVRRKVDGDVGRVLIESVTPLGRSIVNGRAFGAGSDSDADAPPARPVQTRRARRRPPL